MAESAILEFYRGHRPKPRGRYLGELQAQSFEDLERVHDYIQWLFPLPEASSANAEAPILSSADIRAFVVEEALRTALLCSFTTMLRFYGFRVHEGANAIEVVRAEDFPTRSSVWLSPFNHNFLRISRILRSLSLLGCGAYATALLRCLTELYEQAPEVIGNVAFGYWRNAVRTDTH